MTNDVNNIVNNSTVYVPPPIKSPTFPQKSGNTFLSILRGVAGTALNFVMPGLGTAIGGIIGAGKNGTGTNTSGIVTGTYQEMIAEQKRSFEEMQKLSQQQHQLQMEQNQAMLIQSRRAGTDLLLLQNRVSAQSQEFTTISNLLKARHDSRSHAIQNLKT